VLHLEAYYIKGQGHISLYISPTAQSAAVVGHGQGNDKVREVELHEVVFDEGKQFPRLFFYVAKTIKHLSVLKRTQPSQLHSDNRTYRKRHYSIYIYVCVCVCVCACVCL